ncbi:MAG: hypothetical protein Hals2KO_39840 [Halioglobus sp.]
MYPWRIIRLCCLILLALPLLHLGYLSYSDDGASGVAGQLPQALQRGLDSFSPED